MQKLPTRSALYLLMTAGNQDVKGTSGEQLAEEGYDPEFCTKLLSLQNDEEFKKALDMMEPGKIPEDAAQALQEVHEKLRAGECPAEWLRDAYLTGDPAIMKESDVQIVVGFKNYIWAIIKDCFKGNIKLCGDEMLQDGYIGLLQAFHTWNPKYRLTTYAKYRVRNEISKGLKLYMGVTSFHMEQVKKIRKAQKECQEKGLAVTPENISALSGIRAKKVVEELAYMDSHFGPDFDDALYRRGAEDGLTSDPVTAIMQKEETESIHRAIENLPPELKKMIELRFFTEPEYFIGPEGEGKKVTTDLISKHLGKSSASVKSILEEALGFLRRDSNLSPFRSDVLKHAERKMLQNEMYQRKLLEEVIRDDISVVFDDEDEDGEETVEKGQAAAAEPESVPDVSGKANDYAVSVAFSPRGKSEKNRCKAKIKVSIEIEDEGE